jgi:carboxylate-amine ligase
MWPLAAARRVRHGIDEAPMVGCCDSFQGNDWPTLGVEIELQLVDAETMALRSCIGDLLASLPAHLLDSVKPEFMQCYVEINTEVCRTVGDVHADLTAKLRAVEKAAALRGIRLFWAATHPFSRWQDQLITPDERYYQLAEQLRETVVRPVTFGLHVHVGVPSGDAAIRVMEGIRNHLPLLLALSANSPFWNGRWTGHHAHRIEVLEGIPTGGLPPRLGSWDDYSALVGRLRAAGFIGSHRELWWDVRPNAGNGTVEVRICDMPADLSSLLGLTAIIQCLVRRLCIEFDHGMSESECQSLITRQNRWRACRYGMGAALVEPSTLEAVPARDALERLIVRLRGVAAELACEAQLESVRAAASRPNGSLRQLALFERSGDLAEVVRTMVGEGTSVPMSESTGSHSMPRSIPGDPKEPHFLPRPFRGAGGHPTSWLPKSPVRGLLRRRSASG